jgi:lactate dehydrogenase-like 2-hydroxyacid dehydrogenase
MAPLVLVTEHSFRRAEAIFRAADGFHIEPAAEEEQPLAKAVVARGSRAVIVGARQYSGPLYEALGATVRDRGGAILARFGVGHDGIDKSQARRHRIVVTNTPHTLDTSVAEYTVWLIGSMVRNISRLDARFRRGEFAPLGGPELRGKLLAVVGFGSIGRRVAAIAHFGLGMTVLAIGARSPADLERHEQRALAELLAAHGAAEYTTDLDAALARADVVSLHLPATAQTRHIIDAARFARMKPSAVLVNTARGALVDENALYDVLAAGRIGGAALDVFQKEPYEPVATGKDLRALENVILTPHVASNTREANDRMAMACLRNLASFFAGRFDELTRVD